MTTTATMSKPLTVNDVLMGGFEEIRDDELLAIYGGENHPQSASNGIAMGAAVSGFGASLSGVALVTTGLTAAAFGLSGGFFLAGGVIFAGYSYMNGY